MNKLLPIFLIFSLSSCGWIGLRDRSNDYLKAESTNPMKEAELGNTALGTLYTIPPTSNTALDYDEFEVPRPQPISENSFQQVVKIQRLGEDQWILVNVKPEEVWPRLRNILSANAVPVVVADGEKGIIDTQWLRYQDETDLSHRFRIFVKPSVQQDSSEVKVLHNEAATGDELNAQWAAMSQDKEKEDAIIQLLSSNLANDIEKGSVSLLAANIGGEERVQITTPANEAPRIEMKLDAERAWASVLYSADKGGFTIVDKDRSKGEILVNFDESDPEASPGFFSKLFSSKKEDQLYPTHKIRFVENKTHSDVYIVDKDGKELKSSQTVSLLKILRSNLS